MVADGANGARHELDRFRALVLNDGALQAGLGTIDDIAQFVERTVAAAQARAIGLAAEDLTPFLRPDPLGLERLVAAPLAAPSPLQKGWLPIQTFGQGDQLGVDWAYFGDRRLTEPFYEDSIRRILRRPFNRLFRFRTPLTDIARWSHELPVLQPSGFIFHMSRCGSTLAAQMLSAPPQNIVVSEASPIDAVVQLCRVRNDERDTALLTAMIAAFGQMRGGGERHYFVKLDSWHTLALPWFRAAFPSVPWVFLYRDPIEVLVSQAWQRGTQMVPEFFPPPFYDLELPGGVADEDYCARVLARICDAVLEAFPEGNGLLVNYRQLPEALATAILPHFGVGYSASEHDVMAEKARYNAKSPSETFDPDSMSKQQATTDAMRTAVERHLAVSYRRLEALRLGRTAADI